MKKWFSIGVVVAPIVLLSVVAFTNSDSPHAFTESECKDCHIDADNSPKNLIDSETKLCARCHKRTIRASSHPVDVVPQIAKIPSDMPLRNGKITCSTCHNIHADATLVFGERSYFLRRPTTDMRFFCITCHEENRSRPGHKELITLAHMGGQYISVDPSEPLDPLSIECIGCHDGSTAPTAGYTLGEGIWRHSSGEGHPIGVHYRTARMQRGGLAPITELPKKIRFFGGKIGCGTCHDLYSTLPARLVMLNDDSRLCTACHLGK